MYTKIPTQVEDEPLASTSNMKIKLTMTKNLSFTYIKIKGYFFLIHGLNRHSSPGFAHRGDANGSPYHINCCSENRFKISVIEQWYQIVIHSACLVKFASNLLTRKNKVCVCGLLYFMCILWPRGFLPCLFVLFKSEIDGERCFRSKGHLGNVFCFYFIYSLLPFNLCIHSLHIMEWFRAFVNHPMLFYFSWSLYCTHCIIKNQRCMYYE